MAFADYYLCDICGMRTFYDANVNYDDYNENPKSHHPWPNGDIGDMAVLCSECSKKYKIVILDKDYMKTLKKNHLYKNVIPDDYRRCIKEIMPIDDIEVDDYVAREFEDRTEIENQNDKI